MILEVMPTVEWVLKNEIESRDDDDLLVALVDALTNKEVLSVPYTEVMKHRGKYKLFPIESITRSRRLLQKQNPELMGLDWVQRRRARKEKEYREFFHEKNKEKEGKENGNDTNAGSN